MRMILDDDKIIIDGLEFKFSSHEAALITYQALMDSVTDIYASPF